MTARKYTYPGWTLSARSLDGLRWSCQCDTNAIRDRREASCPACKVPRPPDCEHPPSQGERMTRPTKYDDDGVRAKVAEKGRGMSIHTKAALVLAFAMAMTTFLFGYMLVRQGDVIDTLEYRIEYDRTREAERFILSGTTTTVKSGELGVLGVRTFGEALTHIRLAKLETEEISTETPIDFDRLIGAGEIPSHVEIPIDVWPTGRGDYRYRSQETGRTWYSRTGPGEIAEIWRVRWHPGNGAVWVSPPGGSGEWGMELE